MPKIKKQPPKIKILSTSAKAALTKTFKSTTLRDHSFGYSHSSLQAGKVPQLINLNPFSLGRLGEGITREKPPLTST